jgi:hypothetical protein
LLLGRSRFIITKYVDLPERELRTRIDKFLLCVGPETGKRWRARRGHETSSRLALHTAIQPFGWPMLHASRVASCTASTGVQLGTVDHERDLGQIALECR